MNESLRNKLSEVMGANNISYILNNSSDFSVTGYKVMQNQSSSGLLRCAKIMYNGKVKLVYIVDNNKPLSYVATRLGVNELNAVVFNLIQRAMDIKANGFFRAENLELDFNKIFVDTTDYSVHFIYFPVSGGATGKISTFDNEFRIALINLFNAFPVFATAQFQKLCSDLANGSLPLEAILKKLQNNSNGNNFGQDVDKINNNSKGYQHMGYSDVSYRDGGVYGYVQVPQPIMTITSINSPFQMTFTINQTEFLIGKNPNMVHGAVTYNPAISRVHCRINFDAGRYFLTDMGSANGTFINQQRLEKQQTVEVHNGDYLKLANSDFVISF